jgi:hypothetical protein
MPPNKVRWQSSLLLKGFGKRARLGMLERSDSNPKEEKDIGR